MTVLVLGLTAWVALSIGFLLGCWWMHRQGAAIEEANYQLAGAFIAQKRHIEHLENSGDTAGDHADELARGVEEYLRESGS